HRRRSRPRETVAMVAEEGFRSWVGELDEQVFLRVDMGIQTAGQIAAGFGEVADRRSVISLGAEEAPGPIQYPFFSPHSRHCNDSFVENKRLLVFRIYR